jgi:hypothetical protein
MRIKLLSPLGNSLTIYGEKKNIIIEVKMLVTKLDYRILDDKKDIVQLDKWLSENKPKRVQTKTN